ncbi:MAG: hypothetical protein HGB04_01730 [Chlorobiaceae bacterium]|nr:hypothetical protein [Chlorobiaceae bacterium]
MSNKKLENVSDIIERLKKATNSCNDAELARLLGIGSSRIPMWKKRGVIDMLLVAQKCERVSTDWLLTGEGEMLSVKQPLNGREEEIKRKFKVEDDEGYYRGGNVYMVPAIGPLQTPEKIKDGDVLFIDPQATPEDGDFVLVKTPEGPKIERYQPGEPIVGVLVKLIRERSILRQ